MSAPIALCKQDIVATKMYFRMNTDTLLKLIVLLFNLFNCYCCAGMSMAEMDNVLFDMKWPGAFDSVSGFHQNSPLDCN